MFAHIREGAGDKVEWRLEKGQKNVEPQPDGFCARVALDQRFQAEEKAVTHFHYGPLPDRPTSLSLSLLNRILSHVNSVPDFCNLGDFRPVFAGLVF